MGPAMQAGVCVDASFYLTILMPDEDDSVSRRIWREWQDESIPLWAPSLFPWECANGVRQAVRTGRIEPDAAPDLLLQMLDSPVGLVSAEEHLMFAWRDFVVAHDLPAVYDAAYLALASHLDCEFWTADLKLYRTVGHALPWVRAVGFED